MKFVSILVGALAMFCSGCESTRHMSEVGVTLVDLQVQEATLFETTLRVTLRMINENPGPVAFDGGVHKIQLDGVLIGEGVTNERIEVPGLASATHEVTMHLSNAALVTRLRSIFNQTVVEYSINSVLYVEHEGRKHRFSTRGEGFIDFRDFQPKRPAARSATEGS